MSTDWPRVPLGVVLTRSKDEVIVDDLTTYPRLTIRLNGRGITIRDNVLGAEIGTKRQFIARVGQLVLSKIDARNGAFGILPATGDRAIITGNFWAFDHNPSLLDLQFLGHLTRTPDFLDFCIRASEGTTNRRYLQEDKFLAQQIPLPPVAEQRRIVARVDAIADRVAEARRLREGVLIDQQSFVSSLHTHLAGQRRMTLNEVLYLDELRVPVTADGSYPQVGLNGFGGGLFPKASVTSTETTYKAFNQLYTGAVVLSQVKGWEGAIAVCPNHLAGWFASPEYRTFRCRPDQAEPRYLAAIVATEWFWNRLAGLTRGVGARRERVRPELFLALDLPFPTLSQQRYAVQILDRLAELTPLQSETAVDLDALLPAVLAEAFAGRL